MQRLGRHRLAARDFLQLLVGALHAEAAHHGLDRLGQHFPGGVEVVGQRFLVELELAQAGRQAGVGQRGVAEGHADVAQHRAVGQVALPAADRQLLAQVAQQRVGEAEVALGVLEVDRVDLVRHGRRADLALLQALLEVAQAHVAPDVAREVDQDGVGARHRIEQLGHVVVRLDLDAVGLEGEAQAQRRRRLHHLAAEGLPVELGPGRQVRVVVAHRAVHLAQQLRRRRCCSRALASRTATLAISLPTVVGLAVWPCVRESIGTAANSVRHVAQGGDQAVDGRQHHLLARRLDLQRMAGVVDVLAGAGEMHELGRPPAARAAPRTWT